MKQNLFNLYFLILSCWFTVINSQDCKPDPRVAECETSVADMVKAQIRHVEPCIKELGYKSGKEISDGTNCIMKCLMMKEGMLDKNGKLDKSNAANYLISSIPDFLIAGTIEKLEKCGSAFEGQLDNNEKSCKTYEGILNCILETMPGLCHGEWE